MKTRKRLSLFLTLVLLCGLLAGCGASSKSTSSMEYAAAAPEEGYDSAASISLTSAGSDGSSAVPENRKWIVTITLSAETEDLDGLLGALDEKIASLNGFVEDQYIYNGSSYSSRRYRSASLTIRIPAEDADSFTDAVSGLSNVMSIEKNMEDITLTYTSTESRLAALETEEARLLELMEQAETMADLLEIEERLTEVRYQLENAASKLRTYDNKIDYATIYLDIEEVQEYTPVKEPTTWERIRDGFQSSLKGLWESLVDIVVWLIVASPYLVVYGGIAVVIILVVRSHQKKKNKPSKKRPWQPPATEHNDPEQK